MTIEWMYSDTAGWVSSSPAFQWLTTGKVLLLDSCRPAGERRFELLDPGSGRRTPAFDMTKAVAGLRTLLGNQEPPPTLSWPTSLDAAGRSALYEFSGDLFALDLATSSFRRITRTAEEEKGATLSPDGNRAAYVRGNNLYACDLRNGTEQALTRDGSDSLLNGVFSWVYWEEIFGHREAASWWSPDSKSLAFLRSDESGVGTTVFPDFEPYVARVARQRYPQAGQRNPSVTLAIADLQTGRTTWMRLPPASYEYVVRVDWLPGSERVAVQTMNRAQTEVTLYFVDRATGGATRILQEGDDAWMHHYQPLFLRDGKSFLWVSERTGFAHAYRYDTEGRLINQVTRGDTSLQPYGAFSIYDQSPLAAVDERQGVLYYTSGGKPPLERQLYRIGLDGTGLRRLSTEEGWHTPRFSPDAASYLDAWSTASVPPRLTLRRSDGTVVVPVAGPRADLLSPFTMQYPAFFTIPADDGFLLPAQLSKPKSYRAGDKYPVIVYVYGGPGSPSIENAWDPHPWAQPIYYDQVLLDQGFLLFSIDNRSSAALGKKYEKAIKGQMYGDVELRDLLAAVRWLKAQPFVDSTRIGLWGWSGGGMYTLLALTRTREFKAGVAVAPVTDWHYYDSKWTELIMKRPDDNPEGYRKTSLVKRAADLHGRLLLTHGSGDDNVHPQNSQAFMNELIRKGIPFEYMVYPMRKHTIDDPPARIHLFRKMVDFWNTNLK